MYVCICMSNRKFVARPTYTTYIMNYFLFFSRNLGRFSFGTQLCSNGLLVIFECNHFCGGGGGCCTAAENGKMDIRHDEETDVFQGAWWQAISTPGSTSAIDVRWLQIWQDIIRTASTCKKNNFWNYKGRCDSLKDPLSQGMGSSRESYRRRSRDGREG